MWPSSSSLCSSWALLILSALSGRMIGTAFDFFVGLTMPIRFVKSNLPKIDRRGSKVSDPDCPLPTESAMDVFGVNAGASGRNEGPDEEKLKSLWPGVKAGASTL